MKYVLNLVFFVAILIITYSCSKNQENNEAGTGETSGITVFGDNVDDTIQTIKPIAYIDSMEKNGLIMFFPKFSSIDLVCGTMPSKTDSSVIFVAEAAYTGDTLKEFNHLNIAGDHVSKGHRYEGYRCTSNTGAFVYYNGKPKFCFNSYSDELDSAACNGGMGFGQELIIHNKEVKKTARSDNDKNIFRALCSYEGKICIVESIDVMPFVNFKTALKKAGISEAIYLDMGNGWNYAWYRNNNGIHERGKKTHNFCTNWITFYK